MAKNCLTLLDKPNIIHIFNPAGESRSRMIESALAAGGGGNVTVIMKNQT